MRIKILPNLLQAQVLKYCLAEELFLHANNRAKEKE